MKDYTILFDNEIGRQSKLETGVHIAYVLEGKPYDEKRDYGMKTIFAICKFMSHYAKEVILNPKPSQINLENVGKLDGSDNFDKFMRALSPSDNIWFYADNNKFKRHKVKDIIAETEKYKL